MEDSSSLFSLSIDPATKSSLAETAKWARFLAIVGFVFLLLVLGVGIYSSLLISRYQDIYAGSTGRSSFFDGIGIGMAALYLLMAIVVFFPLLFMFRFAGQMQSALASNNQALLNSSFQQLKIYFRFLGIVTVVSLALLLLAFLLQILGTTF